MPRLDYNTVPLGSGTTFSVNAVKRALHVDTLAPLDLPSN